MFSYNYHQKQLTAVLQEDDKDVQRREIQIHKSVT